MDKKYVLEKCIEAMKALSGYDSSLYNDMMGIVAELEDQE